LRKAEDAVKSIK
jgi:dynein heavy chain